MDEESAGGQISVLAVERKEDARHLVMELRKAAKRRKRVVAWMYPLVFSGMALTLLIGFRADTRLSIAIFCSTAVTVLGTLLHGYYQLNRLAQRSAELCDIRAIGPLLTIFHCGDDSASASVETALITLLPYVKRTSQLSRESRKGLARLLLREEMGRSQDGSRYNIELILVALQTVGRLQDCYALPAVRRLAQGYGPVQPVAQIRDLAQDILPNLEKHSLLLRPSMPERPGEEMLLRAAPPARNQIPVLELLRPSAQDVTVPPLARRSFACDIEESPETLPLSARSCS